MSKQSEQGLKSYRSPAWPTAKHRPPPLEDVDEQRAAYQDAQNNNNQARDGTLSTIDMEDKESDLSEADDQIQSVFNTIQVTPRRKALQDEKQKQLLELGTAIGSGLRGDNTNSSQKRLVDQNDNRHKNLLEDDEALKSDILQRRKKAGKDQTARPRSRALNKQVRPQSLNTQTQSSDDNWDVQLDSSLLSQKRLDDSQLQMIKPSKIDIEIGQELDSIKDVPQILPGMSAAQRTKEDLINADDLALNQQMFVGQKSLFYNMIICGSMAKNDEITFIRYMKILTQHHLHDKNDRVANRLLNLLQQSARDAERDLPFDEIRQMTMIKQMRDAINDAFAFSIETGKENLAFAFVRYSREMRFSLVLNDHEIQRLINEQWYALIEDLVNANSVLYIDYGQMDQYDKLGALFQNQSRKPSVIQEHPHESEEESIEPHVKLERKKTMAAGKWSGLGKTVKDVPSDYMEGGEKTLSGGPVRRRSQSKTFGKPSAPSRISESKRLIEEANKNIVEVAKIQLTDYRNGVRNNMNIEQVYAELEIVKPKRDKQKTSGEVQDAPNAPAKPKLVKKSSVTFETQNSDYSDFILPNQKSLKRNLVEKYLKISDLLEYILRNSNQFIDTEAADDNVLTVDAQLYQFIWNFLLNVQDTIDHDRTVRIIIDHGIHVFFIDMLFEQMDNEFIDSSGDAEPDKMISARERAAKLTDEDKQVFRRYSRTKFLVQLINQSITQKTYDVAYEVTKRFLSDLLKAKDLNIFDNLFVQFQVDPTRYEAKIALVLNYMPLMNTRQAFSIMKILGEVVHASAQNSVLRNNINPIRVGLMLYRLIDNITENFAFPLTTALYIKDNLRDQLIKVLDMYTDPNKVLRMVEMTDYEGNDMFWYLDEFNLYTLLDRSIMDRIIQRKWNGFYDVNATLLDYSTSYMMVNDIFNLFTSDNVFNEIQNEMLTLDRKDRVHSFKFAVWKYSMSLRARIEFALLFGITFFFQLMLNEYSASLEISRKQALGMLNGGYDARLKQPEFKRQQAALDKNLEQLSSSYLQVIFAACINLLFPVTFIMQSILIAQTNRRHNFFDTEFWNELLAFGSTVTIIVSYVYFGSPDISTNLHHADMTTTERIGATIVSRKLENATEFKTVPVELQVALLSSQMFLKLILRMLLTKTFGPNFKVIAVLIGELVKFYVLWFLVLSAFTSIGMLLFSELEDWSTFVNSFLLSFESSLGSWNTNLYCKGQQSSTPLCFQGRVYLVIFNSINGVLLLNLVVGILSSIYAFYEDKKLGLFYEVLVQRFSIMQYHEKYGAVACAQPPLNLLIAPFWWLSLCPCWSDESLIKFNLFLCHLIYAPFAVFLTTIFTVLNIIVFPFAYLIHLYNLTSTLLESSETLDEFSEKLRRFITIVKFFFFGPFILIASLPIDTFVFIYNLYSEPIIEHDRQDKEVFSVSTLGIFERCLDDSLRNRRETTGRRAGTDVNFIQLNLLLQKELTIMNQIENLLFKNSVSDKFIYDKATGKQKLAPQYINGIREFILLKKLVANCADKESNVDIELIRALIDQSTMRARMLMIEKKVNDLDLGKTQEEVLQDAFFELAHTSPKDVEAQLAKEGQILDILEEKLVMIKEDMNSMTSNIDNKFNSILDSIEQLKTEVLQNRKFAKQNQFN